MASPTPLWAASEEGVDVRRDAAALEALISAELAESEGDAQRSFAEWQRLNGLVPDIPNINERLLRQAVMAGDMASAPTYARNLWSAGGVSLEARLILITDAVRRSDWRAADRYSSEGFTEGQQREWGRLFGPFLQGWITVGRRDYSRAQKSEILLAFADPSAPTLFPAQRAHQAMMLLAIGNIDAAATATTLIQPTDRTSQLAALQLAAEWDAARRSDIGDALRSRIALVARPLEDPVLMLPTRRVNSAASGISHWFGTIAEGFNRLDSTPTPIVIGLARSALHLDANNWPARLLLAEEMQSLNRSAEALSLLRVRSAIPPVARLTRAQILLEQGDQDGALREADIAVAGGNVSRGLFIMHADFVRTTNDKAKSEAAIERLLADLSRAGDEPALEALLLISLAELQLRDREWEEVSPLIERAVALAPRNAAVLNFAGYSAIERRRDLDRSLERIINAHQNQPQNPNITDSLGWAYFLLGRHDEAVPLLEEAWRGEPSNAVIGEHLGDAYWTVGRRFEARNMWRATMNMAEDEMIGRLEAKLQAGLTAENAAP